MNRYLLAFALSAAACAGAAEDGQPVTDAEPAPLEPTSLSAQVIRLVPPAAALPAAPPAPPVQWRTCVADGDCLLRGSVCAPLELGGPGYCRSPRAAEGSECAHGVDVISDPSNPLTPTASDDCELGLVCAYANVPHSPLRRCARQCFGANDYACEVKPQHALSCDPDAPGTVDAGCEVMPAD